MKWPRESEKCILCKANPPGNWEHVIPESLGGRLQARILCVSCNSELGSELIGNLKQNATVRLVMEDLKGELPELYSQLMGKATFVGKTPDGTQVRLSGRGRTRKVLASKGTDGSIIQDTNEAKKAIAKILQKEKVHPDEIKRLQSTFEEMEENVPLEISDNYTFIKRPISSLQPELNPHANIDERLPVLIAFEFLALLIGDQILSEDFDEIRQYVRNGKTTEFISVEQFHGKQHDTIHGIVVEPLEKSIRIHVRLFRWITFVVTFKHFIYRGPDSVYMEDLKIQKSLFATTREEAKQNLWHELP